MDRLSGGIPPDILVLNDAKELRILFLNTKTRLIPLDALCEALRAIDQQRLRKRTDIVPDPDPFMQRFVL